MDTFMKISLLVTLGCILVFGLDYVIEGFALGREPGLIAFGTIAIAFICLLCLLSGLAWTLIKG